MKFTTLQRQDLLSAAGRVGEASHDLLANVRGQDSAIEEVLLAMAKAVANATAALVLKAKGLPAMQTMRCQWSLHYIVLRSNYEKKCFISIQFSTQYIYFGLNKY